MIGIIGDLHFKPALGYADLISDQRASEQEEILDYIVKRFEIDKCDKIVLLGDQLNSRHNHSQVIKQFVNFIERFNGKELFIIAGNHEKTGDGKSAIDFLKEIKNPHWHIITDEVYSQKIGERKYVFCPYFTNPELGSENIEDNTKKLLKKIGSGDVLFIHHSISDTGLFAPGEIMIDKSYLRKNFKMVFGGHYHSPSEDNDIIVAGSIFTNEVGEHEKFIFELNEETFGIKKYRVPGRFIYKIENPTVKDLDNSSELVNVLLNGKTKLYKNSIVKVILTKKYEDEEIELIKEKLKDFDASIILENIPTQRKKILSGDTSNILDLSIEKLLEAYAKENGIEYPKLKMGFDLIR